MEVTLSRHISAEYEFLTDLKEQALYKQVSFAYDYVIFSFFLFSCLLETFTFCLHKIFLKKFIHI